ncbi:hypothetical protein T484DRAFT_1988847, partial [Baffinella frigidus]
ETADLNQETDDENEETDDENEEEETVKIPGRTTTRKFCLELNLAEGSHWVLAQEKLEFPGVDMLVTIRPTGFGVVSASVGSEHPGVEWKDTGGAKHLINATVIKGYELARAPHSRWIITADMWGTKKDGALVILHCFSLTGGGPLLSSLEDSEDSQVNKYFTATPQDLEENDNNTRFRFTFRVTCELTEAAWASLKPKESP